MKGKFTVIFLLLLTFSLVGCYDIKEIDQTAYIIALGIDKGEDSNFSYTFQFSAPLAIAGETEQGGESTESASESEGNSTVTNLTVQAPDFYVARNLTNNFMSKNIDMSHLKLIVFSANIDAKALENHSQLLLREREIRPHTAIATASSTASAFLQNVNPELESNTSKYYELMFLRSNNVYAPTKRLHDFVDELTDGTRDSVLPIAASGKELKKFPADSSDYNWVGTHMTSINSENSVLCGMAVFKNGKFSGIMDGDSAMIYNILNKNTDTCTVTIRSKYRSDQTLSFRITVPEQACFSVNIQNPKILISQKLRAEFLGSILPEGYSSFDELYSHLRNMITNRTSEFFSDAFCEKSADILNLRNSIRPQFSTWDKWKNFNWQDFCRKSSFSVNIKFI